MKKDKINPKLKSTKWSPEKSDRFNQWIREVVREEGGRISVPDQKGEIIRACKEAKEGKTVKKFSFKKSIAIIAVLCVLCVGTSIAGGKIAYLVSSSGLPQQIVTSYEEIGKIEKKTGIAPRTVKEFTNGFTFEEGRLEKTNGFDEDGNKVLSYWETGFTYQKGEDTIDLNMQAADTVTKGETEHYHETQYGGLTLESSTDAYKFVPVGYEMSEEEKELVDKGELYISEGSDEVENETFVQVSWTESDTNYSLYTMDGYTEEDLIEMAKEMIDNGK